MAKTLQDLLETSGAYRALATDVQSGRVSHAYLLVSPDTAALRMLARMFIVRAEGADDGLLYKRLDAGRCADVVEYPSAMGDRDKLLTEDIDALTDGAYLTPTELNCRYFILNCAKPVNDSVQNKILKTLEEPSEHVRFLLLVPSATGLLPTVVSRCRKVALEPFSEEEVAALLRSAGHPEEWVWPAAAYGRGLAGKALEIAQDRTFMQLCERTFETLLNMKRSSDILAHAATFAADKERLPVRLDVLEIIFRDVMSMQSGRADLVMLRSNSRDLLCLARDFPPNAVLRIFPIVLRAKRRAAGYGNINSVVDELLFSILEVKAKCRK